MEGALRILIIKVKRKWSTHKGVISLASHKDKQRTESEQLNLYQCFSSSQMMAPTRLPIWSDSVQLGKCIFALTGFISVLHLSWLRLGTHWLTVLCFLPVIARLWHKLGTVCVVHSISANYMVAVQSKSAPVSVLKPINTSCNQSTPNMNEV